jgi:hypothetical protein
MANSITGDIHKATTWSIVLSVLMIAAGVLAILAPSIAGVTVTIFFGWLLVFSGMLHLVFAWRAGRAGAVVWEILVGILYGGIGFYLLARQSRRACARLPRRARSVRRCAEGAARPASRRPHPRRVPQPASTRRARRSLDLAFADAV